MGAPKKKKACRSCPLYAEREVPYEGLVAGKTEVVFVGESPGNDEKRMLRPFIGKAGKRLREAIAQSGLKRPYGFVNSARCMINKDELTGTEISEVLECCKTFISRALRAVQPKLIVCLGGIAVKQILGVKGVEDKLGEFIQSGSYGCPVFVCNHPSATLHDPSKLPRWLQDIKRMADFANRGYVQLPEETDKKYKAVSSIRFMLNKQNITVAIDTETQGLNFRSPNSPVLCYSVSDEDKKGYVVWLCGEVPLDRAQYVIQAPRLVLEPGKKKAKKMLTDIGIREFPNRKRKLAELKELLARPDIKKVMQSTYDLHRFEQLLGPYELNSYSMDIQAGGHVIDENTYQMASLDELQKGFTDMRTNQKNLFTVGGYDKGDMLSVPPTKLTDYAGADADGTRRVAMTIRKKLLQDVRTANYFVELVMPVTQHVIYTMERNGIYINQDKLFGKDNVEEQIYRVESANEKFVLKHLPRTVRRRYENTGKGLVLTRRDILRDYLFDTRIGLGLEPMGYTKGNKGTASVDKNSLKLLLDHPDTPEEAIEVINAYLKYSEHYTLRTRYIQGIKNALQPDGYIYPSYGITKAVTGRMNSFDPNAMNFPKRSDSAKYIRQLIAAPKGYVLLEHDYDQSELRWVADQSGDPRMIEVYATGGDIHVVTAESIMGKRFAEMDEKTAKEARRNAKPVNFGLIYGMGPEKLQLTAHTDYGVIISIEQATQWRYIYFNELYVEIPRWHERQISFCKRHKYVRSPYGRIRHLLTIDSHDRRISSMAERQAINSPIQSASSDSGLLGCAINQREKRTDPTKCHLSMFIHDASIHRVKEKYAARANAIITEGLENLPFEKFGLKMKVPLKASSEIGPHLADMHKYS